MSIPTRALCALAFGCTAVDVEPDDAQPLAFCEEGVGHRYDPVAGAELLAFPDDFYTVADASSPTGRRLALDVEGTPWIASLPDLVKGLFVGLDDLSGFGHNTEVLLRFDAPVGALPDSADASLSHEGVQLWDMDATPPRRLPYSASLDDEGRQVRLQPLVALRAGARHGVLVTRAHTTPDGGCVVPSPTTRALVAGTVEDAALAAQVAPVAELLSVAGVARDDVGAVLTFTTHDALSEGAVPVVADLRSRTFTLEEPVTCTPFEAGRACQGRFVAFDYRVDQILGDGSVRAPWSLPLSVWLPDTDAPAPVVFYGHGLNSSRGDGATIARLLMPLGIATVSLDALAHGDHPTAEGNGGLAALPFLGLDLAAFTFDGRALRGHLDQTTIDRLQLLELLRDEPDLDGDGEDDVDPSRMATWGISLGGMLGSSLLALDGEVDAGVLQVPGGGLIRFATDTAAVGVFLPVLYDLVGGQDGFNRLLVVGQTLVDPADPSTYGAHVLRDRLDGGAPPHVLVPLAMEDETVPPATGRSLARAMGLPHVPPVVEDVPPLTTTVAAPVQGNLEGRTAGFFQYDRVTSGQGVAVAGHDNTPLSPEGRLQALHFFEGWLDGTPEIVDPYAELGTPELP